MNIYDNTEVHVRDQYCEQSPPLNIARQSPIVSTNAFLAAMPSDPIYYDSNTIDPTGNNDIIEESNDLNLEEPISSNKVIHRQSPGNLPKQQTVLKKHKDDLKVNRYARRHKFTRNVALNLVCSQKIEGNMQLSKEVIPLPKPNNNHVNISDNDDDIPTVEVESAKPSSSKPDNKTVPKMGSPQQQIVLNVDTKSINLRPSVICYVSRVDPVPVQPFTVTCKTQDVPVSHVESLQPTSTVPNTTQQLPVSGLPVSLPQVSDETSFCQLRYVCSVSSHTSIDHSLMVSQPQTTPVMPISEHTASAPEIQNQKKRSSGKRLLPAPKVTLSRSLDKSDSLTIILSWTMNLHNTMAEIMRYEIFASQEISSGPTKTDLWKKVAVVNALDLPMSCSFTLKNSGEKYNFSIRAEDVYSRVGPLSIPQSVFLD